MSVHVFQVADPRSVIPISLACHEAGQGPTELAYTGTTLTLTFLPDLSPALAAALPEIVRAAQSILTRTERNAIEPQLATGRLFVQQSQAEFIALTQNARDRMLFDNVTAQWRVIFRLLRDG